MCQDKRGTDDGIGYPRLLGIAEDPHEPCALWLATAGAGICRFRPDRAPSDGGSALFTEDQGLAGLAFTVV